MSDIVIKRDGGGGVTLPIAISDVTNLQTSLDGKQKVFATTTDTDLTIDLATASYFFITLATNSSFTLSNLTTGVWTFNILNSDDAAIVVTIPTTANDIYQTDSVSIDAGKVVEISLASDGTKRVWLVSQTLTVGS